MMRKLPRSSSAAAIAMALALLWTACSSSQAPAEPAKAPQPSAAPQAGKPANRLPNILPANAVDVYFFDKNGEAYRESVMADGISQLADLSTSEGAEIVEADYQARLLMMQGMDTLLDAQMAVREQDLYLRFRDAEGHAAVRNTGPAYGFLRDLYQRFDAARQVNLEADLAWLEGTWMQEESDSVISYESWEAAAGGQMKGSARTEVNQQVVFQEQMSIYQDGNWAYYRAEPGGQTPVEFLCLSAGPNEAWFKNPSHDFPQMLHYLRSGEDMTIEIIGTGPKGMRTNTLRLRRVK